MIWGWPPGTGTWLQLEECVKPEPLWMGQTITLSQQCERCSARRRSHTRTLCGWGRPTELVGAQRSAPSKDPMRPSFGGAALRGELSKRKGSQLGCTAARRSPKGLSGTVPLRRGTPTVPAPARSEARPRTPPRVLHPQVRRQLFTAEAVRPERRPRASGGRPALEPD